MDIKEELLFDENKKSDEIQNNIEDIAFIEPAKSDKTKSFEVLFKNGRNVSEESLNPFITPATVDPDNTVATEVLFKFGVEDIAIQEDSVISEESINFTEPVRPDYVSEEVLFNENSEIATTADVKMFDEPLIASEGDSLQISFGDFNATSKPRKPKKPFAEKMLIADPNLLENYQELKNILLTYKKVKSRISNTCDTFNLGRTKLAKLSVSGKSLKLYVNLNLDEVEPRLRCKDASAKRAYEEVPVFLRIRSPRSMKYAKILLSQLAVYHQLVENPKAESVDAIALLKDKLENK